MWIIYTNVKFPKLWYHEKKVVRERGKYIGKRGKSKYIIFSSTSKYECCIHKHAHTVTYTHISYMIKYTYLIYIYIYTYTYVGRCLVTRFQFNLSRHWNGLVLQSGITDKATCVQYMVPEDKMRHIFKYIATPSVTHSVNSFFLLRLYLQSQTKYMESPKADVLGVSH